MIAMTNRTRILPAVAALCAASLVLVACHSPRGGAFPRAGGSSTYTSTETMQKTVSMVDVRTGDVFFSMDIPPGKQLTFDFATGRGNDEVMAPDLMRYQVFDAGTIVGRLRNAMSVPNAASRRIDVSLHRTVEFAEAPPDEPIRVGEGEAPDWWTPRGGELPRHNAAEIYD